MQVLSCSTQLVLSNLEICAYTNSHLNADLNCSVDGLLLYPLRDPILEKNNSK